MGNLFYFKECHSIFSSFLQYTIFLQSSNGPTWTVRRPRARREPLGRGKRDSPLGHQDVGDAEGIDALLRLADVAQNASMHQHAGTAFPTSLVCRSLKAVMPERGVKYVSLYLYVKFALFVLLGWRREKCGPVSGDYGESPESPAVKRARRTVSKAEQEDFELPLSSPSGRRHARSAQVAWSQEV